MTEEDVLTRIGAHAREEQKDDARFERVARGTADEAELAELERAAAVDPELAMRLEGSRPLEGRVIERIAARAAAARTTRAAKPSEVVTTKPVTTERPHENVHSLRGRWRPRLMTGAGAVALAAAMLLYVMAGPNGGSSEPELPSYTVTATGEQAMRGPAEPSKRLRVGSGKDARFELVLRPATAPGTKIVAYGFSMMATGDAPDASPLDAKIEVAPEGAVRITGRSRMIEGAREIRVVIGAPASIGKFDDAAARAKLGKSDPQVHVVVIPVDYE
jgi:hypothetical protein